MEEKNKQSVSFDIEVALATRKWLNYDVGIDERRGCGQEKQTQNPEEQLHLFLLAVLHFCVYMCCYLLYCTWAKSH